MDDFRMGRDNVPSRSGSKARSFGRSRSPVRRKGNNKKKKFRFFNKKWILLVLLTTVLLVVGGCSAVLMSAPTYKSMDEVIKDMKKTSVVMDTNGKEAMKLGGENLEYVKLEDVKSKELPEAFVKVEDERFYEHNGVDYWGLGRAVVKNIIALGKAEGASTITMQVARNTILDSRKKTYTRKLREIGVAVNLDRKFKKEKILEVYLNYIDFGNGVKGIKMAAKIYFGKDITKEKLEPQEIAMLAGMPKAPYGYDPYKYPEKAKQRRNVVLMKMAEDSTRPPIITEKEKEQAQKTPLGVDKKYLAEHLKSNSYSAYKAYMMDEVEKRYPQISQKELVNGGYKVYTALDPKAQESAQKAVKNDEYYQGHEELDAGLTMMDPRKGEVVAVGGGRNYLPGYKLRATENHQPGSTIKPITVYSPLIQEEGYNEHYPVKDEPIRIGEWEPKNYTGQFYGTIPMQEMVEKSLNASTVRLLKEQVGLSTAAKYGEKAGLKLEEKDSKSYAALALGGLTKGVDTVQMAQAYSALANNGANIQAHTVRKIVGPNGEELTPKTKPKKNRVYSKKTAYYMTRMLESVVQEGTGVNAQLPGGRPVAGKTGTTQNSKEAWFVGYTPQYVTAVTVFKTKENEDLQLTGGSYPAKMFKQVMADALNGKKAIPFKNPGVPEPQPPFELKPVSDLSGSFDGNGAVNLKWTDYANRVKYRVQRSEDQSDWQDIGETEKGSFSDSNIKVPESNALEDFFGGKSKKYYYRVIAVDTQAEGDDPAEAKPSNVVGVTVAKKSEEEPPDEERGDEEGDEHPGEEQQPGEDQRSEDQDPSTPLPGDEGTGNQEPGNEQGNQGDENGNGNQGNNEGDENDDGDGGFFG
ncbi:transglycosylase domain-containing protein [Paludifilum halophilum]|uniref:Uncharacterized protein n=1 Tax=Paludifilum halophilum TaxID=1642702 RepID=A0A235B6A4_9BACL|nr:transglycosylase domain-containing protein [Paludifilum halophilum]OYD07509.1 hypothetical protein CHM34_11485 [Paludifilum halophilum]